MINEMNQYWQEKGERQKQLIFEGWIRDEDFDMEVASPYSFKPREFLTSFQQDWDFPLDQEALGLSFNESF